MTARVTAPYGSWPSPISAADVARARLRLAYPTIRDGRTWWQETRPDAGGRTTLVRLGGDGERVDVLPAPWNARTRVHEYGGRSYLPVPTGDDHTVVFAHYDDQRLYRLDADGAEPRPLTPEPATPAGTRYADFALAPDATAIWCVREHHTDEGVRRAIVSVPLDGSAAADATAVRELTAGADFYAYPAPSPDGTHLAWVQWNHPRMPWDGTELRVATIEDDGTPANPRTVKGGPNESVLAPAWRDDKALYVISDWSGWWNLYQVDLYGGSPHALYPAEEEFAGPLWTLGGMPYTVLDDGRLAVLHGQGDQRLGILDPETVELTDIDLPYTDWTLALSANETTVAGIAGGPGTPMSVVRVDLTTGRAGVLRREIDTVPDSTYLPAPRAEELEGAFGRPVHALVHPPANPMTHAPDDELPPYVVFVHGGPTGHSSSVLSLERAYFTSRGIGVIDVDYGGSSGYGRAYRERLRGEWGVVDVADAVAAAQALVERGEADGDRLAVRGHSAGGWTTLSALTQDAPFKAGTSYYGITDLMGWLNETHDFESRYLFGLVGPIPGFEHTYRERSPLTNADRIGLPVLLLQGLDDPIVAPAQAERIVETLGRNKTPHAYLTFEGESHGFRRTETVVACLEAELSFYGQALGFTPKDIPTLELTTGPNETDAGVEPSPT